MSGYALYGPRVLGDVLRNLGGHPQVGLRLVLERILKIAYGLSVLATVPWLLVPVRHILAHMLPYIDGTHVDEHTLQDPPKSLQYRLLVMDGWLLVTALLLALTIPNVEFIFGLVGATSSVTISLILPSLMSLSMHTWGGSKPAAAAGAPTFRRQGSVDGGLIERVLSPKLLATAMLIFGLGSMVGCTRAVVGAMHKEQHVVALAQAMA